MGVGGGGGWGDFFLQAGLVLSFPLVQNARREERGVGLGLGRCGYAGRYCASSAIC